MADANEQWMKLLRELFGADADAALEEMKRMGMDPSQLAQASGLGQSPAMMEHVIGQIRSLMQQSAGEDVNFALGV